MTAPIVRTFAELMARGELYDIAMAAKMSGYSEQHLRRLCIARKVSHKRRGTAFLFTKHDIEDMFVVVEKKA
jgi:hypothetical protein